MSWSVTFDIYGESFNPEKLEVYVKEKLSIAKMGFAQLVLSKDYTPDSGIKEIHKIILTDIPALTVAGAENWHVNIGRFYDKQCNEEFSLESMKRLVDLKCGFIYSAYDDE
jgi:hypothetical protein